MVLVDFYPYFTCYFFGVTLMYVNTVSVVTDNKFIDINGEDVVHYGTAISVDCCMNKIHFHDRKITINVNEKQKRLIMCLLNDINRKQDIIKVVWYENYKGISDNNYHQLIHKFRLLLTERNLPGNVIKTINRYGLRLDTSLLASSSVEDDGKFYGYA